MNATLNAPRDVAMQLRRMLRRPLIAAACLLALAATAPATWAQVDTATPTPEDTFTATPADTPTDTPTAVDTPTDTATAADTPTDTPAPVDTATDTPVPADTATHTAAPVDTATDTPAPADTATDTPAPADTATDTPAPADTPTDTPVAIDTPTDTPAVPADTPTDTPALPADTPTDTPIAAATDTPTDTPADTPTDTPVAGATATDTAPPVNTPTDTAVSAPTATDTPVPATATDTALPTDTPVPTSTPPPTNTLPPTRTYTPTILPLKGSSVTIRPLVQAQCGGAAMCNQLGITFAKGRVRLELVRQANVVGDRQVGEVKIKRVFRPQPELRAEVVGDIAYGADPDGDCPLANTQALGAVYATGTLECVTKRGASNCKGILALPAFTPSACTDVSVVVTNAHFAVYDIVAPGSASSLIARDGIKIRGH